MAKRPPINQDLPEPLDDNKKRQLMVFGVVGLMIIIVLGWFYSLPYLLDRPVDGNQSDDQTVDDLKTALQNVKENFAQIKTTLENQNQQTAPTEEKDLVLTPQDIERLTEAVIAEQTAGWKSYNSFDHNFSFKYPVDWTIDSQSTKNSWQLTDPGQTTKIVLTVKPTAEVAEPSDGLLYQIDQTNGQLYKTENGSQLVIKLPNTDQTLLVTGNDSTFQLLLATITFLK